jgi:hypothetical protein
MLPLMFESSSLQPTFRTVKIRRYNTNKFNNLKGIVQKTKPTKDESRYGYGRAIRSCTNEKEMIAARWVSGST